MYCSLEAIAATLSNRNKKLLVDLFVPYHYFCLASFVGSFFQVSRPLSVNLATGKMNVVF